MLHLHSKQTANITTLQEKIVSGKEKIKSLAILESLLQSGVPILIDLIHRSLCRKHPLLLVCLEFSVQQWKSWLGIQDEPPSPYLYLLDLRTSFHNFENDPREFFYNLHCYIQTVFPSEKKAASSSSPFPTPFLVLDSIDALVMDDVLPFLRFARALRSSHSFFFCFSPSLHTQSSLLAVQQLAQGYLQLTPHPRHDAILDAPHVFRHCINVHVQQRHCRCELVMKRPRGKLVSEVNDFDLRPQGGSAPLSSGPFNLSTIHPVENDNRESGGDLSLIGEQGYNAVHRDSDGVYPVGGGGKAARVLSVGQEEGNQAGGPSMVVSTPHSNVHTHGGVHPKPNAPSLSFVEQEGANVSQNLRTSSSFSSFSSSSSSSLPVDLEGLTFDLSLTPRQKEARAKVKLPYLEAQSKPASGLIHYNYDVNDDFDEDDPDADLEF